MWESLIRGTRRALKPLIPRRLLEARRRWIRRHADSIYAGIGERLDLMFSEIPAEALAPLDIEISPATRSVIDGIEGRLEDIRFSPNGRMLALAAFEAGRILILDVAIVSNGGGHRLVVGDHLNVSSRHIRFPHGVAFIDDDTIAVANRAASVAVFRLPRERNITVDLVPALRLRASLRHVRHSPGSLDVHRGPTMTRIVVCNNEADVVTAHQVSGDGRLTAHDEGDLVGRGLHLPDGIAFSHDASWIAVSNHGNGLVLMYPNSPDLGPRTEPVGELVGIACPHGVRFLGDRRTLVAADAAGPWIHVFASPDGDWSGPRTPVRSVRVMDQGTWLRGHLAPGEGGPKGIDIDPGERVLVTTCETQRLGVFDMAQVLGGVRPGL